MFKRLKNIKDKNEEQLETIKNQGEKQLKAIDEISKENEQVYKLLSEFKKIDKTFDNAELICTKTDGTKYVFNRFCFH